MKKIASGDSWWRGFEVRWAMPTLLIYYLRKILPLQKQIELLFPLLQEGVGGGHYFFSLVFCFMNNAG